MGIKINIPKRPKAPKAPKAPKPPKAEWLGKIKGHDKEFAAKLKADLEARERAAKSVNSTILTRKEVQGETLNRNLMTTLGGSARRLTPKDLATFRANIGSAIAAVQSVGGITPQQVLNLAKGRPLNYNGPDILSTGVKSDVDKARREITSAVLVSAVGGDLRFITPSGGESRASRHVVLVRLHDWRNALAAVAAATVKNEAMYREAANNLRRGKISFECDCERHRYYFRYLATIGGFNAGRAETGYPKIRNPDLKGVACKHVIRVMTELLHSPAVLRFLIKHIKAYDGENMRKETRTQMSQKDADKVREVKNPRAIRSAEEQARADARANRAAQKRQNERETRRQWAAQHQGISLKDRKIRDKIASQATKKPTKTAGASKMAGAKTKDPLKNPAVQKLMKEFGLSPEKAAALFAAANQ